MALGEFPEAEGFVRKALDAAAKLSANQKVTALCKAYDAKTTGWQDMDRLLRRVCKDAPSTDVEAVRNVEKKLAEAEDLSEKMPLPKLVSDVICGAILAGRELAWAAGRPATEQQERIMLAQSIAESVLRLAEVAERRRKQATPGGKVPQ